MAKLSTCQNPKCGQPIPDERLHRQSPYRTCSSACEDELRRQRNRRAQAKWYKANRDKKIAQTVERNRRVRKEQNDTLENHLGGTGLARSH